VTSIRPYRQWSSHGVRVESGKSGKGFFLKRRRCKRLKKSARPMMKIEDGESAKWDGSGV
jgi:hypothetical protein